MEESGAPGAIRTPDPQIRSLMLYPAELRVRGEAPLRGSARVRNPLFRLCDDVTGGLAACGVEAADFRRILQQQPDQPDAPVVLGAHDFGARGHRLSFACDNDSIGLAARLQVSTRTLVRRLEQRQTTYRALLDFHRRSRCAELLAQPSLSVAEIAERLGYEEPTNFARACRRWFGLSPRAYRARIGIGPGSRTSGHDGPDTDD